MRREEGRGGGEGREGGPFSFHKRCVGSFTTECLEIGYTVYGSSSFPDYLLISLQKQPFPFPFLILRHRIMVYVLSRKHFFPTKPLDGLRR